MEEGGAARRQGLSAAVAASRLIFPEGKAVEHVGTATCAPHVTEEFDARKSSEVWGLLQCCLVNPI
jgi:hypothetical protein